MVNWSELLSWLSATKEEQSLGYELGRFRNLGCRPVSIVMVGFSDPVPKVFPVPPSEIHWHCWQLRWVTYGFSFVFLGMENSRLCLRVCSQAVKLHAFDESLVCSVGSWNLPERIPFDLVLKNMQMVRCDQSDTVIDTWRLIMHRWWHWDTHILHSTLFLLASMDQIEHAAEVDHGKII